MLPARLSKLDIQKHYRWIAPMHDVAAFLLESKARRCCLQWADIQNGETILEVAVGTGLTFKEVLKQNPTGHNTGLDLTPAMLTRAKNRAKPFAPTSYTLEQGDAYTLPYADASFDLVLNNYMFDLLPETDMTQVLQQFKRVLRPGGRLVMTTLAPARRFPQQVWDALYRLHPAILGGCRGVSVSPFLEDVGFINVRQVHISQLTFPSEVVMGLCPK